MRRLVFRSKLVRVMLVIAASAALAVPAGLARAEPPPPGSPGMPNIPKPDLHVGFVKVVNVDANKYLLEFTIQNTGAVPAGEFGVTLINSTAPNAVTFW